MLPLLLTLSSAFCLGLFSNYLSAQRMSLAPERAGINFGLLSVQPLLAVVTVNPTRRDEVADLFQTVYRASEGVAMGWNGDSPTCTPGTNALAYSDATILRVNYYRAMAGLPGDVTLNELWNSKCMDAALMMSKQGDLSHTPGTNWACYTVAGAEAAGRSNLSLGREGPRAVDGYIDDDGGGNAPVGHRRWILYPRQEMMGTGSIPERGGSANVLWVIGGFSSGPTAPAWVAWPPQGYVPYQVMPQFSGRWSLSRQDADFSNASVVMSHNGSNVALTLEPQHQGYGDNTIVWIPKDVEMTKPSSDILYTVTVGNVVIGGMAQVFTYNVTLIDPDAVNVAPPLLTSRFTNQYNFILYWHSNAAGFALQSTHSLSPAPQWSTVEVSPTIQGPESRVILDASTQQNFFRLITLNTNATPDTNNPAGMVLIPAGSFTMGDTFGEGGELPTHPVQISDFYIDTHEVTKSLWEEVSRWAASHGYSFESHPSGKAARYPAEGMTWYDAVKWCNARSEMEGRMPAYYTSAERATVYRGGQINIQNAWVNWAAGYRLPTEAEWEKAARGGVSGHRFPWSDADTITHSRANYYSRSDEPYDVSSTRGFSPGFALGFGPYTSPVGSFAANGYGLYDMAGNVSEWCWDSDAPYSGESQTDPRGSDSFRLRVLRGGGWGLSAFYCRSAARSNTTPDNLYYDAGFRSVLSPGQP